MREVEWGAEEEEEERERGRRPRPWRKSHFLSPYCTQQYKLWRERIYIPTLLRLSERAKAKEWDPEKSGRNKVGRTEEEEGPIEIILSFPSASPICLNLASLSLFSVFCHSLDRRERFNSLLLLTLAPKGATVDIKYLYTVV